jgi:hypothetical protein
MIGGRAGAPGGNATEYTGPYSTLPFTVTQAEFEERVPFDGTISDLGIRIEDPPGAPPKAWTFTIMNGAEETEVSCTIGTGEEECTDLTDAAVFKAGDLITLRSEPTGQPTNTGFVNWTVGFDPSK